MMQEQPTDHPIRRRKCNNFRYERCAKFGRMSKEWMEWIAFTEGIHIQHQFNRGEHAFRIGNRRLPVDGWDARNNTVYQFHG